MLSTANLTIHTLWLKRTGKEEGRCRGSFRDGSTITVFRAEVLPQTFVVTQKTQKGWAVQTSQEDGVKFEGFEKKTNSKKKTGRRRELGRVNRGPSDKK